MFKHGLFSNRPVPFALPIELALILIAVYMSGLNTFISGASGKAQIKVAVGH